MIHIVTQENRRLYHHALMEMHVQRKTVFIDELKWRLDASSVIKIDAYDSAEGGLPDRGRRPREPVTASARLLPTTAPHLRGDVFAHLCADGPSRPFHPSRAGHDPAQVARPAPAVIARKRSVGRTGCGQ